MRERKFLFIGCVALLVVCVFTIVFVVRSFSPSSTALHAIQATVPAQNKQVIHEPLPASDVTFLEEHMNSSDMQVQSLAWVPSLRDAYATSVSNPLPAGVKFAINAKSFWHLGDYGEIAATVGNEAFVVHLERFDGQWFIAWTTKQ